MRAGALSEIDAAQTVATTAAQIQPGAEGSEQMVYMSLGLLLLSFVGIFGVAPRFKSSFKEEITCEIPKCLSRSIRISETLSSVSNSTLLFLP